MNIKDFKGTTNLTIDEFVSIREDYREEYFYNLCSADVNSLQIKKLFLLLKSKQLFNNELLSAGLLGAIQNKQDAYIDLMINFAEQNKIKFNQYQYNPLFNCAFQNNNDKLASYFEENYNVINQNLSKEVRLDFFGMKDNGEIITIFAMADGEEIQVGNYLENNSKFNKEPLEFAILNMNHEMLNFILEKSQNQINPQLLEELVIDLVSDHERDPTLFLINNEITRNIIKNSSFLNLFLNEPTQFSEIKREIKAALLVVDLNNDLENNNKSVISKPKL